LDKNNSPKKEQKNGDAKKLIAKKPNNKEHVLTKDLEEKLDRFISNQVDETLEDEIEDHRQQVF
jgi:hypothetical protein